MSPDKVVTILLINGWELALKAYIARFTPDVKLHRDDGITKPFEECLAHVASRIGKAMPQLRDNIEVVYRYRCDFLHYYVENLDVLLFGLIHKSVELYHRFVVTYFGASHAPQGDFVILPIGFKKPLSPIDFLTNESALSSASVPVKSLVEDIVNRTERLESQGVEDLIFVPFSMATVNEKRVKNADLVAAISKDQNVSISVKQEVQFTENPEAKEVRVREEALYGQYFPYRFRDVVEYCRANIPGWKQNKQFYALMRELKQDPNLHRVRLLDPDNPNGPKKDFYSDQLLRRIASHYSES